jgi:heme exporter protein C
VHAVRYLRTNELKSDIRSRQYAVIGILFGLLGYATGIIWASFTWADPNQEQAASFGAIAKEPKLVGAAIALLIYAAYLVLRDSITDLDKKARISAGV